jgi:hypothetical protein
MSFACKNVGALKKLHRCGRSQRPHLIGSCSRDQILAICECSANILRGDVKLTKVQKQRFEKHFELLKNLADSSIGWKKKQNYLKTQEGGAITAAIISAALPALLSYIATKLAS